MGFLGQDDKENPLIPQVTQAGGSSAEQLSKRQKLSTPNSSERTHPTVTTTPLPTPPSKKQLLVENVGVLCADQGNNDQPLAFEIGGSFIATGPTNKFGDESPFYIARPYVLNEHQRASIVDSAIEDRKVAMGLASTLLTPSDSEIRQGQSSTDLRIDGFHSLVVVRILYSFILCSALFFFQLILTLLIFAMGPKSY